MTTWDTRFTRILLFVMVFWTVAGSTGLLSAASSHEEHPKRHGSIEVAQPPGQPDPDLLPLWAALLGKASGPVSVAWSPALGHPACGLWHADHFNGCVRNIGAAVSLLSRGLAESGPVASWFTLNSNCPYPRRDAL